MTTQDELQPPGSHNKAKIKSSGTSAGMHTGVGSCEEGTTNNDGIIMHRREADLKLAPLSNEDLLKEPDKIVDMDEVGACFVL